MPQPKRRTCSCPTKYHRATCLAPPITFATRCPHTDRRNAAHGMCHNCNATIRYGKALEHRRHGKVQKPYSMSIYCAGGCGRRRKPGPEFYTQNGVPRKSCKICLKVENAAWIVRNPEKHKAATKRVSHRTHLRVRFGITPEQFEQLVAQSDGLCATCRQPESRERRLSLDHDHTTGALRGFLCSNCNLLIGHAHDSVELLENVIQYLKTARLALPRDIEPTANRAPGVASSAILGGAAK